MSRLSRLATVMVLVLATLSASCSQTILRRMVPTPIVMQDPRLDFSRIVAPDRRVTEVSVFFATTRAPAPPEAPERYTSRAGDAARLGVAKVQLGEPGWSYDDLVQSDRTSRPETPRPARVVAVEEFGIVGAPGGAAERELVAAIDRQIERVPNRSVVIYVPGYRATFDQVMVLMGSWAHFLGSNSIVIAFSWPTGTQFWNYLFDCPRARAFVPDIARLIALVAEKSQARRLNLVAFSCGSPLLADALVQLRQAHPDEDRDALQRRYRIANDIFIAADIDLQTFARSHLPALSDMSRRTEVYLSEDDAALRFAGLLARASRLGRPRFDELTREDLETLASDPTSSPAYAATATGSRTSASPATCCSRWSTPSTRPGAAWSTGRAPGCGPFPTTTRSASATRSTRNYPPYTARGARSPAASAAVRRLSARA